MSAALDDKPFPKMPLIAAVSLVVGSVALVGAARLGLIETPAAEASAVRPATSVLSRDMRFMDLADGGVRVVVAGEPDRIIPAETGGFVRGVLRSLVRHRQAQGLGDAVPFRVTHWSDDSVSVHDPATGRMLKLDAFGVDNRQAFLDLMTPSEPAA